MLFVIESISLPSPEHSQVESPDLPTSLRVLITNNTLAQPAGSEIFARDLALTLLKRGHYPVLYSTVLGRVAEELRRATVPVIDDLAALQVAPDVLHGQHHLEAMTAMLRFPHVPAIYFCHGWAPWQELPPVFPSIARYVAVDDLCRERLLTTAGIKAEKVSVIYNSVDLSRFKSRTLLPAKPRSALIFSNYATESNFVGAVRAACQRFGIEQIDVVGMGYENSIEHPERVLPTYDLVFAKAKCALEAMAVGCAVIVADTSGLGGLVTSSSVKSLRNLNFGVRTMQGSPLTDETVYAELTRYDANDARQVSEWIRANADLEPAMSQVEQNYSEIVALAKADSHEPTLAWALAASDYLRSLAPIVKTHVQAQPYLVQAQSDLVQAKADLVQAQSDLAKTQSDLALIHASPEWRFTAGVRRLKTWLKRHRSKLAKPV